jgi:tetratricopeptide (TPR) repeat protein
MTKLSSHIYFLIPAALGLALTNAAFTQDAADQTPTASDPTAETAAADPDAENTPAEGEGASAPASAPADPAASGSQDPTEAPESLTGDPVQDIKFYYSIGRHDRALEMIQGAPTEVRTDPDVSFTLANILALRKEWKNACSIYERLLKVWPTTETIGGVQTRFNLSECYYVLGRYEEALELYNMLYEVKEQRAGQTFDYLQFKIYLTNQLLGNEEQAQEMFQKFDEFSMTPNFYYASATQELVEGDTQEGLEWVRSAWNIYDETINNAYTEALHESGLLDDIDPSSAVDNARVGSGDVTP